MAVTITAPLTLEEFSRLPRGTERHEVNTGELVTLPPVKSLHTLIALAVLETLQAYLRSHAFARAVPQAGYVLSRDPLTIRQPDISVLRKERVRSTKADDYVEGAPELAVEVVSPSDPADDLQIKVDQYLQAGAQQVWVLYPRTKHIHVFYAGGAMAILDEAQLLEGSDVLPGFSVRVADLFLSENHASA